MIKLQIIPEREVSLQVLEPVVKPVIAPKRITENGTYAAKEEGVYGFDPVTVEVDMTPAFEAGQKAEYDRFWDAFQDNGNRTVYDYAFRDWAGCEEIKPKYPIRTKGLYNTFFRCFKLKQLPKEVYPADGSFDICYAAFAQCYALEKIEFDMPIKTTNLNGMSSIFSQCYKLVSIGKITVDGLPYDFTSTFYMCNALENVTFGGTIAGNLSFYHSSKLSLDSVQSAIDAMQDRTGTTALTLTLHKDVGKRLTEAQKAEITAKNWILVY